MSDYRIVGRHDVAEQSNTDNTKEGKRRVR